MSDRTVVQTRRQKRKRGRSKLTLSGLNKEIRQMKGAMEKKFIDVTVSGQTMSTAWFSINLNDVADGPTVNERSGQRITGKSLNWRGSILAADDTNVCRVIFIQLTNPASVGFVDVLEDVNDVYTPYKINSEANFKILSDTMYSLEANASGQGDRVKLLNGYIDLKNLPVAFSGAGAVSHSRGLLQCLVASDSASPFHPTMELYSRFRYSDA